MMNQSPCWLLLLLPLAGCNPAPPDPPADDDGIVRTALHDFRVERWLTA